VKEQDFLDNLVGVFGQPAAENPGVVIQEDVDPGKLADAIAGLKAMKMRGIDTTFPRKIEVLKYRNEISPRAQLIGAVNTGGKGSMESLSQAGASSITRINIPRDEKMALSPVELLGGDTEAKAEDTPWEGEYNVPEDTEILINATAIGLDPNIEDKPQVDYDTIPSDLFVQDVMTEAFIKVIG